MLILEHFRSSWLDFCSPGVAWGSLWGLLVKFIENHVFLLFFMGVWRVLDGHSAWSWL